MMRLKRLATAVCLVVAGMMATKATAQTAEERAASLKTWRAQCADPDPTLRLAYLEAAIATTDLSIQRICIREALENDDADVRNLGLRAALATMNKIAFETWMPPKLDAAYKQAGNDEDKLREINRYNIVRTYDVVRNGLVFDIKSASITSGQSVWYPLATRDRAHDNYRGDALVVGSKLTWHGAMDLGGYKSSCTLAVVLTTGAVLEGALQCDRQWAIPVAAPLL